MKTMTKAAISLLLVLTSFAGSAWGQATQPANAPGVPAPSFQGFQLPRLNGSFQYAITASELATTGSYLGANGIDYLTTISGDIAYVSQSKARPFSLVYSGGYFATSDGQPSVFYQNLSLSQVLLTRSWDFVLSDSVSYLPQSATIGLSGIAGVGDLGVAPVQIGPVSSQGILTGYATQVDNITTASVERKVTGSTWIQGSGSLMLLRFVGASASAGIDSNMETASVGPSHRIDARNTVSANYTYARFTFSGTPFSFTSQGVNLEYFHRFSRKVIMDVSMGPQRTTSSPGPNQAFTTLAANITSSYTGKSSVASINYTRGTYGGAGVAQGALTDDVGVVGTRALGTQWTASVSGDYVRSSSLPFLYTPPFTINTIIGGVQTSRALGRNFFAYASYTAQQQSIQSKPGPAATLNAFNGFSQVIGIGLTYSPASVHLGHR